MKMENKKGEDLVKMVYRLSGEDDYIVNTIDNYLKKGVDVNLILRNHYNYFLFVSGELNLRVVNNNFLEFRSKDSDELYLLIKKDEVIGVRLKGF